MARAGSLAGSGADGATVVRARRRGAAKSQAAPLLSWAREHDRPRTRPADPLRVTGLFAGVGGIELGLHRAGHCTLLMCESDPGAAAVLRARFPSVPIHDDVRALNELPERTTLLAAGFPCQDLSQAGMTRGIGGARSGLVGEVFRLLEVHSVPWVLLENVPFMLQLAGGRALDVIVRRLETLGYRWAHRVVDSRAFGLPQRRERVFLLASKVGDPRDVLLTDDAGEPDEPAFRRGAAHGFYWTEGVRGLGWAVDAVPTLKGGSTIGIASPPAILLPDGRIVKPDLRDAERMQGFEVDWTKPAEAVVKPGMRWKMVGNAVTVDVAAWIGERLRTPGEYKGLWDHPLPPGAPWPHAAWNVGDGRFTADVSAWPKRVRRTPLHRFLQFEAVPLSVRGTEGFLKRARSGRLRFPEGFLDAVAAHLKRMRETEADGADSRANEVRAARAHAANEASAPRAKRTARTATLGSQAAKHRRPHAPRH